VLLLAVYYNNIFYPRQSLFSDHTRIHLVTTSSAVYMAGTRPRIRDVYTAMYGPSTRPCTRHVYGRVHVSTCTRAVYMAVYGPSTRPKKAVYTAVHGCITCRVYCRVRAVSARVHGSVRSVCMDVFGRVHWPCTLPFSAVYIARTRPCNGPCTQRLHGRVQGLSGLCIRQLGLPGRVHFPRRHATAVCGPLRRTLLWPIQAHNPNGISIGSAVFAQMTAVLNIDTSSTCPHGELRPTNMAEKRWRVWGTPANFNGFRVLAALLQRTLVLDIS